MKPGNKVLVPHDVEPTITDQGEYVLDLGYMLATSPQFWKNFVNDVKHSDTELLVKEHDRYKLTQWPGISMIWNKYSSITLVFANQDLYVAFRLAYD